MRGLLNRIRRIVAVSVIAGLAGCATVRMASNDVDSASKRFVPPEGKASVYLVRPPWLLASAFAFRVSVDGTDVADIAAGTFVVLVLGPGRHAIAVNDGMGSDQVRPMVAAGRTYFFDVAPRPWQGVAINRLDESEGKDRILGSRQASNLLG